MLASGISRGTERLVFNGAVDQSEWATDVMFKSPQLLASLYPRLIRSSAAFAGPPA